MEMPCTRLGPRASTATVATREESIPPESPITASREAVLRQVVAGAEHQRRVDLGLVAQRRAAAAAGGQGRSRRCRAGLGHVRPAAASSVTASVAVRPSGEVDHDQVGGELGARGQQRARRPP